MMYKDLIVIDGSQLSGIDSSIPEDVGSEMNADQFFELGNAKITERLHGFALPPMVTFGFEDVYNFDQLLKEDPQRLLQDYFDVIAYRLKADPIVVSILDGSTIRPYLDNEDNFVNLAQNLFNDLDLNEEAEINRNQMRTALLYFGSKIGVPSFSDLAILNVILKKHEVEKGEEKVDQGQFAELLKSILQDVVEALALNPVTVQREDVKIATGGIPKQLSEEDNFLGIFTNLLYQLTRDESEKERSFEEVIKNFLEDNATTYGIPPLNSTDEAVVQLYDAVFYEDDYKKRAIDMDKSEVGYLGKKMLEKFATELESHPVLYAYV